MNKAILGKKLGMTQVFSPKGIVIPVTVVEATPNTIVQIKNEEKDGYNDLCISINYLNYNNNNCFIFKLT